MAMMLIALLAVVKVQQQVTLTLSQIYSESQHCGRTYCDGDPPERIGRVRAGWLNVIASDKEMQAASSRELLDRFKMEKVFWRQLEIGQALAAANNRGAIAELEMWLTHEDRHLRDNVAFVLRRLDEAFLFAQSLDATSYERQRDRLREERTLAQINPGLRRTRSAARLRPLGPGVARLQAAAAAAVLSGRDRVRRHSIQSNRRNGTTFLLLGAV
jgi:hypothetical protein